MTSWHWNVSILDFIAAEDDGNGSDKFAVDWTYSAQRFFIFIYLFFFIINYYCYYYNILWVTGIRGLMRGMATFVNDKVGRPPGELGVSKSMECDIFPSVF